MTPLLGYYILYLYPRYGSALNLILNKNMDQKKSLLNFKKTRSLLDKLIKMTEDHEYCINIMQQNLAVIGMLKSAHQMLMEGHLNSCFKNAMGSKNEKLKTQMMEELIKVTKMGNK